MSHLDNDQPRPRSRVSPVKSGCMRRCRRLGGALNSIVGKTPARVRSVGKSREGELRLSARAMQGRASACCWLCIVLLSRSPVAAAFGDQWYLGTGGGVSMLRAIPADTSAELRRADDAGSSITLFAGRDFEHQSSLQLQVYSFGDAVFNNGETARYAAADATVIYRFFDTRDKRPDASLPLALYGRLGLGYIERASSVSLSNDDPVFFGAGAGVESYFTRHLGMRLEAFYHEVDTASVSLSLVTRFGGANAQRPPLDRSQMTTTAQSAADKETTKQQEVARDTQAESTTDSIASSPQSPVRPPAQPLSSLKHDDDGDGIANAIDQCPGSTPGYPIDGGGCSPLSEIATGLTFAEQSSALSASAIDALDQLATLLNRYPAMRVELVAHTDNTGTEASQSALTRQRLRSMGIYLLKQGVDKNRLLLRSFAAKRPAFDNSTVSGRRANNRVQLLENP